MPGPRQEQARLREEQQRIREDIASRFAFLKERFTVVVKETVRGTLRTFLPWTASTF